MITRRLGDLRSDAVNFALSISAQSAFRRAERGVVDEFGWGPSLFLSSLCKIVWTGESLAPDSIG